MLIHHSQKVPGRGSLVSIQLDVAWNLYLFLVEMEVRILSFIVCLLFT